MGQTAENLAFRFDITRREMDVYSARSHQRVLAAQKAGYFAHEIVPLYDQKGMLYVLDDGVREDSTPENLAKLRPFFDRKYGNVTAGNSSPLNDGAAMLLLGDEAAAARIGAEPLARVVSRGVHGVDPDVFGIAPVEAANKALARAGIGWGDVDVVELNEAFASQSLACLAGWPELDPAKLNARGGAIAIGHPLGASGARVVGRVAHELASGGGRYGLATLCIGVGQGLALVLERP